MGQYMNLFMTSQPPGPVANTQNILLLLGLLLLSYWPVNGTCCGIRLNSQFPALPNDRSSMNPCHPRSRA
jgi:hypothetical protein